jgi:REP element-mobilizing transposase RayT
LFSAPRVSLRERSCRWFIEALERARATHGCALWAYVIMPEHVHLLVYPGHAPFRMADFLYTLKKSVSNRALEFEPIPKPENRRAGSPYHRVLG